jgi:hypothetical protein
METLEENNFNVAIADLEKVLSSPKDWTIETIFSQIQKGNIDLNPKFQRRNVWSDEKRSTLIESIYLGYPVPPIVLAEKADKKGHFIVVDGKQRLSALAGFLSPTEHLYWNKNKLVDLKILTKFNGKNYKSLCLDEDFERRFQNISIRVEMLRNIPNNDIMYDIFYRLNTSSTSLSTQDLRIVLYRGGFTDYLMDKMDFAKNTYLQQILDLDKPDPSREDDEIILRFLGSYFFGNSYKSSLKDFLDETVQKLNNDWEIQKKEVEKAFELFDKSIERLSKVFEYAEYQKDKQKGFLKYIGRMNQFNKALFEVQVYAFAHIEDVKITEERALLFVKKMEELFKSSAPFYKYITQATNAHYKNRFKIFIDLVNECFETNVPLPYAN